MQKLSQNNPAWSGIKLGTSTNTTIGSHGCTITAISMLAGLTPDEVNKLFNKFGVYAQTNLVNWTKINAAISWLKFEWRGYSYENDKVAAAIKKNGACLVAVDGRKIGGGAKDGHWVLYIGNQKMIDPWDGQEKPTSHYPATGYAIINVIGEPKSDGDNSGENIPVNKNTFEKLVRNSTEWGKTSGEYLPERDADTTNFEDVQRVVNGYKSRGTDMEKQRDEALRKLSISEQEVENQKDKLANVTEKCQRDLELKNAEISALKSTSNLVDKLKGQYEGTIKALETSLREAQKTVGQKDLKIAELTNELEMLKKGQKTPSGLQILADKLYTILTQVLNRK